LRRPTRGRAPRAQSDVDINCKDAAPVGGKVQECLAAKRALLSWDCQEQLFRQEVEDADDMRLSARLFRACLTDKKQARARVRVGYGAGLVCSRIREKTPAAACAAHACGERARRCFARPARWRLVAGAPRCRMRGFNFCLWQASAGRRAAGGTRRR